MDRRLGRIKDTYERSAVDYEGWASLRFCTSDLEMLSLPMVCDCYRSRSCKATASKSEATNTQTEK